MLYLFIGLFLEGIGEKTRVGTEALFVTRGLALAGFGPSKVLLHKSWAHHLPCILCEWCFLEDIRAHSVNTAPEVVQHGGYGSQSVIRTRNLC